MAALKREWSVVEKILVTGASGFVGTALCRLFHKRGIAVVRGVRAAVGPGDFGYGELDAETDWSPALGGCSCVIHLAARVHRMNDSGADLLATYRRANVDVTLGLARQALAAGVRRFVFVSTAKVNGECSGSRPFTANDVPRPADAYSASKYEAEQELLALGRSSSMEVVVVRPPLVYGPGVRANFLRLMQVVKMGAPLPFALVKNRRSLVGVENLVDFLAEACVHPSAAGKVWMVSDMCDLTIKELIQLIALAMNRPARLFPVPPAWLAWAAGLAGKRDVLSRLIDPLQVDASPTAELLGWTPPFTIETELARTVFCFLANEHD
jgi:nucleoside-diphosphate-sugar epimerase